MLIAVVALWSICAERCRSIGSDRPYQQFVQVCALLWGEGVENLVLDFREPYRTKSRQYQLAPEKIAGPIGANPDCLEFRVFQDRDDPQSFVLPEHSVSLEANTAHGQRDYMADYMSTKANILSCRAGS